MNEYLVLSIITIIIISIFYVFIKKLQFREKAVLISLIILIPMIFYVYKVFDSKDHNISFTSTNYEISLRENPSFSKITITAIIQAENENFELIDEFEISNVKINDNIIVLSENNSPIMFEILEKEISNKILNKEQNKSYIKLIIKTNLEIETSYITYYTQMIEYLGTFDLKIYYFKNSKKYHEIMRVPIFYKNLV